jgi:hypothetical protein
MTFRGGRDRTTAILDEVHDEEVCIGVMHARHRQLRHALEFAEHVGFDFKARMAAAGARLTPSLRPSLMRSTALINPKPTGRGPMSTTPAPSAASSRGFNHDEAMRDYCGSKFGGIAIERTIIHVGRDGRRFLVMHGDEFDIVVSYARWLALFGDWSYIVALWVNTHFPPLPRSTLLVTLGLSQAAGEAGGELYR